MLTLPIKRKWLDMIVTGEKREEYREITDYWTKRFVNLLGESDDHANVILQNLRDHRIDKECEVLLQNGYNPDGSPQAVAVVTISIGGGREDWGATPGVDYFVLKIKRITETKNMNKDSEPDELEKIEGKVLEPETVPGNPNAPAVRKMIQCSGICKYCHQIRFVEIPEGATPEQANEQATEECDCDEAIRQRERKQRMQAAGEWAKNVFSKETNQLQVVLCAIRATFEGSIDYVTLKIGKHTYKVDTDSDGMIRIRTTCRESDEETF